MQQVVFEGNTVKGKHSAALKGEYTVLGALDQLLKGSGLTVRRGESGLLIVGGGKVSAGADATSELDRTPVLEEIVVTAQKRAEPLREVPISVSAVTGDQLQRQGATRLSDFAGYVPSLTYSQSGVPGEGTATLRGVTTATSPTAATAIYVDDVPTTTHGTFASNGSRPADLFPYDLERVEVLRGPQGTLYGDSTIGGLVKYVTKTADVNDFSGAAGVEAAAISGGDEIGGGARAMVNAPIVPGIFGVRLSGFYQETPGYMGNVQTGEKDTNEVRQRGMRVAARLTPTEALSVDAQWLHNEYEADNLVYTAMAPGTTRPLYGDYKDAYPLPQPSLQKFDLLSATMRYDFGPATLTSVTGYSKANRNISTSYITSTVGPWVDMLTGGAVNDALGTFDAPMKNNKFTQELRLASAQDQRLTWLLGAYYTVENADASSRIVPYYADATVITSLLELYNDELTARYTDLSAFANATFKITDQWEISGGVRQSRITDAYHERGTGTFLSGSPTVPVVDNIKSENDATTWSLGSRYIASDDLMVFVRAASGFRAGGINYTWPGVQKSYNPDSLVSYEAGFRADFLSHKASIDLTVYYLDWKDLFISAYTEDIFPMAYQVNGGKVAGPGVEFTGTLRPVRNLTLAATAAYTGLRVREDLPTLGALDGDRTPTSPAWTGSISADYTVPIIGDWDLRVGGGVRMASHTDSRFIHDPLSRRLDGYAVVDLNAAVSHDQWTLRGYVKNLGGDDTVVWMGGADGVQMTPRTIGLALDVRF